MILASKHLPLQSEVLRRIPRSLEESPAISPHWRYEQAYIYLKHFEQNPSFAIPTDEDDDAVIWLYSFLRYNTSGSHERDRAIGYCFNAVASNPLYGSSSRLKSLVVANSSQEEIANRSGCSPSTIQMFERLFFDIRRFHSCTDYISSVVFPFDVAKSEPQDSKKERLWMATAFLLGAPGLDRIIHKKVDTSTTALNEMSSLFRALATNQGVEFLLSRRAGAATSGEDYDRVISLLQIPKDESVSDSHQKTINFTRGLIDAIHQNTGGLSRSLTRVPEESPIAAIQNIARELAVERRNHSLLSEIPYLGFESSGESQNSLLKSL